MTLVDHVIIGYRSATTALNLVWHRRILFLYSFLGYVVGSFIFSIGSLILGLGAFGIYKLLHQWLITLTVTEGLYIVGVVTVFVIVLSWIKVIFEAALLKHVMTVLHDKKMTFGQSFDFDKGLGKKLFLWSIISLIIVLVIGFLPRLFHHVAMFYITYILLAVWLIGIIFVIPVLIKRNEKINKAVTSSFGLAWRHLPEIFVALFVLAFFVSLLGFLFGIVGMSVTWLVCSLLSIPVNAGLILPFVLIAIVPFILLVWYFITVIMALPAVLFHHISKK